jgi:hypothetical protein
VRPLEALERFRRAGPLSEGFPLSHFRNFEVYGHENGGVEVVCALCIETVAMGGCACCEDNAVTLFMLTDSTRDHACKEKADG